jgi:thiol-disulfide isomerase/thioredoxin
MSVIEAGRPAPAISGIDLSGPRALWFYKVTCPVCQMAAPVANGLGELFPGRIVGVGQDPPGRLEEFSARYGLDAPSVSDGPPYAVSDAYGIETVPTLVLVNGETVVDVVQSWDRDGYNRASERLADLTRSEPGVVSEAGDGLPPFRPG